MKLSTRAQYATKTCPTTHRQFYEEERVELMNGTLSINSRLTGGTKIDIEIPMYKEALN